MAETSEYFVLMTLSVPISTAGTTGQKQLTADAIIALTPGQDAQDLYWAMRAKIVRDNPDYADSNVIAYFTQPAAL